MRLKHLELVNFRNYERAGFDLQELGNLIIAPNGAGKTNLLEAMAYCGMGRSIRFHRDEELCKEDKDHFRVKGDFCQDDGLELKIQLAWQEGRKLAKINDIPVRQLSKLYECVKIIYCAPDDMNLVGGSPRYRRQFFDLAISQIYPPYISVLRNYMHIVEQRNNLLKKDYQPLEKNSWDRKFIQAMLEVLEYRREFLNLLNREFAGKYLAISEQVNLIRLDYVCQMAGASPEQEEDILACLADLEPRERKYQRSLIGAHLDDYEFKLDGRNLKTFGSQGQKRITVLVLKLIQAALTERITGIKPILLFDDVFAELDKLHSKRIRDFVDYRYQVFVASPREDVSREWGELTRLNILDRQA